jgi:hypothetical protein
MAFGSSLAAAEAVATRMLRAVAARTRARRQPTLGAAGATARRLQSKSACCGATAAVAGAQRAPCRDAAGGSSAPHAAASLQPCIVRGPDGVPRVDSIRYAFGLAVKV